MIPVFYSTDLQKKKKCYTQTYLGFRATLNDAVEQ